VFAPVIIGVIAVWNAVACSKMIECKNTCANCTFPSHLSSTYSRIAYAGAGNFGVAVTDFSIIITLVGVCIAYQITFSQLLQEVPWTNFSTTTLTTVFAVLALPLCCVPNVGVLAVFSLFGLVCLITSVIAIIVYGVLLYGPAAIANPLGPSVGALEGTHAHVPLWPESLGNLTSFVGVATFCFGLCSLAFPVEESMRDQRDFGKAVVWALIFVWAVYMLFGDVGAFLYVHDVVGIKDNILSNLPTDSFVALLVRLAMTAVRLL
jgi:amino acid permease